MSATTTIEMARMRAVSAEAIVHPLPRSMRPFLVLV
jgi:hypothetical protein